MAHCPFELLEDLAPALDRLRKLDLIVERKPGIFYIRSDGFLHFHIKGEARWAHVKQSKRGTWAELPIPLKATTKQKAAFVDAVIKAHKKYLAG